MVSFTSLGTVLPAVFIEYFLPSWDETKESTQTLNKKGTSQRKVRIIGGKSPKCGTSPRGQQGEETPSLGLRASNHSKHYEINESQTIRHTRRDDRCRSRFRQG